MASNDLIGRIREGYSGYTKAEKKVANYILENTKKVLFMSITDLADACEVGDTSVFRFCRSLRLQGYQEFKMQLSLSMNHDDLEVEEEIGNINLQDPFEVLAKKVLQNNINAINETYGLIQTADFAKVMHYLETADSIHFFGVGASMLTSMFAMNKFLKIIPNVRCVMDSHMQAMSASMLGEGDVAIVISYSGATKDTIHVAKLAKQSGARVICLTRYAKSPLTVYSDVTLLCGANEGPLDGGSTSSQMSQMFLIDIMYNEFYRKRLEVTNKNIHKTADAVLDKIY
ncbi:MurR/RpiR family transcriptional regulator [Niameybacter massiliensis]|uniref:MurR/RpiR family transcriptional regulator n=1 Tax=Holtiella tumoricola TaxID=3018743 RepID=A0AA42DLI2_9FIRM|nr:MULTISPECIES: MurR/RpiR family transcriptional regulator [Lachnospirales]MDA3731140.1 MurR/RpiR family transcriptional regulator [Holtiella tumoricola]